MHVRVHVWSASAAAATLQVTGSWGVSETVPFSVGAGESNFTVVVGASAEQIKLWWPAGTGAQPLYNVTVALDAAGLPAPLTATRRIGFRYFALVTGNDTDPNYVKQVLLLVVGCWLLLVVGCCWLLLVVSC